MEQGDDNARILQKTMLAALGAIKADQQILKDVGLSGLGEQVLIEKLSNCEYVYREQDFNGLNFGGVKSISVNVGRPILAGSFNIVIGFTITKSNTDLSSINTVGDTEVKDVTYRLKQYGVAGATRQTKPSSYMGGELSTSKYDSKFFFLDMLGSIERTSFTVNNGNDKNVVGLDQSHQNLLKAVTGNKYHREHQVVVCRKL